MFEKFTQKAIDIIMNAQIEAGSLGADKVYSEHVLLGLVIATKGVQAKLIGVYNINIDELKDKINKKINLKKEPKTGEFIPFSKSAKDVLEKTMEIAKFYNNSLVTPFHIALAIFHSKDSGAYEILKEFNIDEQKIIPNIMGILNKKAKKTAFKHPEQDDDNTSKQFFKKVDDLFTENSLSNLLSSAKSKLSTYGYEILGTEQITDSVLDIKDSEIVKILEKYGITKETFDEKLKTFSNRLEEYGERQIIFTPNAFRVMLNTFEAAKEFGSVEIKPEHIILGILKAKTGIAYKIIKELTGYKTDLEEQLIKELNTGAKTMPETLAILRLAKAECTNLNKNIIGTEMILLGILAYKNGVAAAVLEKLGITLKDARLQVENLIGNDSLENDNENIVYTQRAKKLLEIAYEAAKNHGKEKIMSEHILYAITKIKDCVAMKILENLGTDTLEIKQGILSEMENIQI